MGTRPRSVVVRGDGLGFAVSRCKLNSSTGPGICRAAGGIETSGNDCAFAQQLARRRTKAKTGYTNRRRRVTSMWSFTKSCPLTSYQMRSMRATRCGRRSAEQNRPVTLAFGLRLTAVRRWRRRPAPPRRRRIASDRSCGNPGRISGTCPAVSIRRRSLRFPFVIVE